MQHDDTVGDLFHDREVMADEQRREAQLPLERGEEVEYLRLDGHVEGRGGFVRDE